MKKSFLQTTLTLLAALFIFTFISCGYEPVFYGIMHDVVPEKATVSGNITSIARCTIDSQEYLVLSGGANVKYKKLESSEHGHLCRCGILISVHNVNLWQEQSPRWY